MIDSPQRSIGKGPEKDSAFLGDCFFLARISPGGGLFGGLLFSGADLPRWGEFPSSPGQMNLVSSMLIEAST